MADQPEAEGLVAHFENPHHLRSKLLRVTKRGEKLFREMARRQQRYAVELGTGLRLGDVHTATRVLRTLRERLAEVQR